MNLLTKEATPCRMIVKADVDDGRGGRTTSYIETRNFKAVLIEVDSTASNKDVGMRNVSAKRFKVMFQKDVALSIHDVFRTFPDGMVLKVTSDTTKCAKSSTIQYNLVYAEEWSLPNG